MRAQAAWLSVCVRLARSLEGEVWSGTNAVGHSLCSGRFRDPLTPWALQLLLLLSQALHCLQGPISLSLAPSLLYAFRGTGSPALESPAPRSSGLAPHGGRTRLSGSAGPRT